MNNLEIKIICIFVLPNNINMTSGICSFAKVFVVHSRFEREGGIVGFCCYVIKNWLMSQSFSVYLHSEFSTNLLKIVTSLYFFAAILGFAHIFSWIKAVVYTCLYKSVQFHKTQCGEQGFDPICTL